MSRLEGTLHWLMTSKYGPKKGAWHFRMRNKTQLSAFWKGILLGGGKFWPNISFTLENGESVSFSNDRWISEIPLKISFPKCYDVALNKESTVADN